MSLESGAELSVTVASGLRMTSEAGAPAPFGRTTETPEAVSTSAALRWGDSAGPSCARAAARLQPWRIGLAGGARFDSGDHLPIAAAKGAGGESGPARPVA